MSAATAARSSWQLPALAVAAGAAVANLYYNQPVLGQIGHDLHVAQVGQIATATQLGYTAGLVLLAPLGDVLDRRRLILSLCALLVGAAAACALAPGFTVLLLTSALLGVCATITQILVPLAADLVPSEQRGKAVGTVFGGALCGILLARTLSGLIGQAWGWRAAFWCAALLAGALWLLLRAVLPRLAPRTRMSYGALLRSLLHLMVEHAALRRAAAIQACVFGAFSAFWSVLALRLQAPPYQLGPAVAGAFGLVGVVGVLAAQGGGRWIDRRGPRIGLLLGVGSCLLAFVLMFASSHLAWLIAGVVALDLGVALAQVSNQSVILGLSQEARARINTLYVTVIFFGGSLGSAAASLAWQHLGWSGVCAVGGTLALIAWVIALRTGRGGPG